MTWTIEGKISEWTFDASTASSDIKFKIKATTEYSVKINNANYNCLVENPPTPTAAGAGAAGATHMTAILNEESIEFKAANLYLPVFTSCKDNIILFELDGTGTDNLKSITVK